MTNKTQNQLLSLAIVVSGNGTNLQAIIDSIKNHELDASIAVVVSNNPKAYALQRAQQAHIPTECLISKNYSNREDYDATLSQIIDNYQPDLIVLAGFMRILTPRFVSAYKGQMINIHPSLLPKYPGLKTYARALQAADKQHGSSIHFVTEEVDGGPLIAQTRIDILPDESVESLSSRVQTLEHQLYPLVIQWFCEQRIKLFNNSVIFDDKPLPNCGKQVTFNQK